MAAKADFQGIHMGVSKNSGTPKGMVKIMEIPIKNGWFGGTIIFGNTHIQLFIDYEIMQLPVCLGIYKGTLSIVLGSPLTGWFRWQEMWNTSFTRSYTHSRLAYKERWAEGVKRGWLMSFLYIPKNPWTLQWKGPWTSITGVFSGSQNSKSWGVRILRDGSFWWFPKVLAKFSSS